MRATTVAFVGLIFYIIGAWAHNKSAANVKSVVAAAFVLLVLAMLDQGETEDIAKGFAWLFLIVILLSPDSPITGIAGIINKPDQKPPPKVA